jgi:hypothetical protein
MARKTNWLSRRSFKPEITGSSPVRATYAPADGQRVGGFEPLNRQFDSVRGLDKPNVMVADPDSYPGKKGSIPLFGT